MKSTDGVTLQEIAQRKSAVRQKINAQKAVINAKAAELVAPLKPATANVGGAVRLFNTGLAVFDGVLMGLRIMRRVQKLLRR